jgi:hypothetical protein
VALRAGLDAEARGKEEFNLYLYQTIFLKQKFISVMLKSSVRASKKTQPLNLYCSQGSLWFVFR